MSRSGPEAATTPTGDWDSAHAPVVVAVDGSDHSRAAVRWAAEEAGRAGADLRVVSVAEDHHLPRLRRGGSEERSRRAVEHALDAARGAVDEEHLSGEVLTGGVEESLLEHLGRARLLAVGKRGLHTIPRLLVGSTSLSLAGRCPVPTAVVPEGWSPGEHSDDPVVVGVDPDQDNARLLHLAFRRADRCGVPLVAVHGYEHPEEPQPDGTTAGPLTEALAAWQRRFPAVEVRLVESPRHPAMAVLDAAERSQLVVLGRRHDSRFSGFGFGSVTRAVLHYAPCPVLVVPSGDR